MKLWRQLGLRGKLFLTMVGLVVVVVAVAGIYLERELRSRLEHNLSAELERLAHASAAVGLHGSLPLAPGTLDPLADRIAEAADARITLMDAEGNLLGDSALSLDQLRKIENHSDRPEVQTARAGQVGESLRRSTTVDLELIYVAVRLDEDGRSLIARAARRADVVDAAAREIAQVLVVSGIIAILLSIGVAFMAASAMSRRLRELIKQARAIADTGRKGRSQTRRFDDEFAGLAGTFQHLSRTLESTVAELAEERDRFLTVLDSMGEAVIGVDENNQVVTINGAAERIFDVKRDVMGEQLVAVARIPALVDLAQRALRGLDGSAEFQLARDSATPRTILAYATPLTSASGAVIVLRDVTEVRRLETIRRDFVANVSHELRTPVSIVQASAETLHSAEGDIPPMLRSFVEKIQRNAERMARLISDLLDLSRIEADRLSIGAKSIELSSIWAKVKTSVTSVAEARGATVDVDIPARLTALCDPNAVEQVLVNLIENAIKYGPEGGTIWVSARPDGAEVRVEVHDEGPGIAPEHRARVFERFYRVDPGRSRDMGGTGLGLAIVRHLVEAMNGRVGVEGRKPNGSVFWISLPRGEAQSRPADRPSS